MVGLTDRQRHDGQGRVFCRAGGELAAVADEKIGDVVALAPSVDDAILSPFRRAVRAEVMRRWIGRRRQGARGPDRLVDRLPRS